MHEGTWNDQRQADANGGCYVEEKDRTRWMSCFQRQHKSMLSGGAGGGVATTLPEFLGLLTRRVRELSVYEHVLSRFIHIWLFATLWTVTHQTPLSVGFSRQEYWNVLLCPSPGDLRGPGSNLGLLHCWQVLSWLSHGLPFPEHCLWKLRGNSWKGRSREVETHMLYMTPAEISSRPLVNRATPAVAVKQSELLHFSGCLPSRGGSLQLEFSQGVCLLQKKEKGMRQPAMYWYGRMFKI